MKFKNNLNISFNTSAEKHENSRLNDFINAFTENGADLSAIGEISRPNRSPNNNPKV